MIRYYTQAIVLVLWAANVCAMHQQEQDRIVYEVDQLARKSKLCQEQLSKIVAIHPLAYGYKNASEILTGTVLYRTKQDAIEQGFHFLGSSLFAKHEIVLVKRSDGGYSFGMHLGHKLNGYEIVQVDNTGAKGALTCSLGKFAPPRKKSIS